MKFLVFLSLFLAAPLFAQNYVGEYQATSEGLEELESYSKTLVEKVDILKVDGETFMKVNLSSGLVGENQKTIVMKKLFSPIPFVSYYKGEIAGATCTGRKNHYLSCKFRGYDKLDINLESVESFWKKQKLSADDLANRVEVANKFSGDPIGKLRIWKIK